MPSKNGVLHTADELRQLCDHVEVILAQMRGIADTMDEKKIKALEIKAERSKHMALERFEAWRSAAYKALTEWLTENTGTQPGKKLAAKSSSKSSVKTTKKPSSHG